MSRLRQAVQCRSLYRKILFCELPGADCPSSDVDTARAREGR